MDEQAELDQPDAVSGSAEAEGEDEFGRLIDAALASLPPSFLDQLGSVAIVVEDEPTPAQLAAVGAHGLYGLYQGVPRTAWGARGAPMPSKITIFRGPIARSSPTPDALAAAVTEVVHHEVAHHLGISDARLSQLARERGPR